MLIDDKIPDWQDALALRHVQLDSAKLFESHWLEYKIWIGHGKTKLTPTKYMQNRYWMIFIVFMHVGLWYWFDSLVYFWFNIYQCRTFNSLHFDPLRWCCFGLGILGILVQMLPGKRAKCFWDALNWKKKHIEIRIQKLPETWFCRLSPKKWGQPLFLRRSSWLQT